jgi:hypothetical protein
MLLRLVQHNESKNSPLIDSKYLSDFYELECASGYDWTTDDLKLSLLLYYENICLCRTLCAFFDEYLTGLLHW